MSATTYKPVYWGEEPVSTAKLNQMVNNTQWVYENMPRMNFAAYGVKKTSGIKIMAGTAVLPATGAAVSALDVSFGNFFTAGCRPVVVTGIQPTSGLIRFYLTVRGISENNVDHRGVKMQAVAEYYGSSTKTPVISNPIVAHYIAVGW